MYSVFIYFKASASNRAQTLSAINALGTAIASATGASFNSARRAERDTDHEQSGGHDTWLEHYQCVDDQMARAVLGALNTIDPAHPLLALIDGGFEGRHLEYFIDTTTCV